MTSEGRPVVRSSSRCRSIVPAMERTAAGPLAGDPQDALEREENRRLVWTSLNDLSPDMRMAVIFRDLQGRSYEEIAAVLKLEIAQNASYRRRAQFM